MARVNKGTGRDLRTWDQDVEVWEVYAELTSHDLRVGRQHGGSGYLPTMDEQLDWEGLHDE